MHDWQRVTVAVVLAVVTASASSYRPPAPANASTSPTPIGKIDARDFCMHESFTARCEPGSVVLMLSAVYGRMRLGRCIRGDYNVGCSTDVVAYFDAHCTGRQSCHVGVRNLIDIHPCQRDFTSYLEASYRCIRVDQPNESSCETKGRMIVTGSTGYLSNLANPADSTARPPSSFEKDSSPPDPGSEACPWTIVVRPGQTVALRVIVLPFDGVGKSSNGPPRRASDYNPAGVGYGCAASFVIREPSLPLPENSRPADVDAIGRRRRHHYSVCARNSRERHLYTSAGNAVSIHVTSTRFASPSHNNRVPPSRNVIPRFIINYEAVGCADLLTPANAWLTRAGENVIIRCNDTHETWYFTCQRGHWLGDAGNCSTGMQPLQHEDVVEDIIFPTHGLVLAVLTGITLGIAMGMVLLITVHCARYRSRWQRKRHRAGKLATRSVDGSSVLYTSAPTMTAYFRRRPGTCGGSGPLADDQYPALLVTGSTTAACDTGDLGPSAAALSCDLEKVYDFAAAAPDYESRDDDVIDCCPRHYQMALVDGYRAPPPLETFRPGADAATAAGVGECCPLITSQHRYSAATAAVLHLHDRRRCARCDSADDNSVDGSEPTSSQQLVDHPQPVNADCYRPLSLEVASNGYLVNINDGDPSNR